MPTRGACLPRPMGLGTLPLTHKPAFFVCQGLWPWHPPPDPQVCQGLGPWQPAKRPRETLAADLLEPFNSVMLSHTFFKENIHFETASCNSALKLYSAHSCLQHLCVVSSFCFPFSVCSWKRCVRDAVRYDHVMHRLSSNTTLLTYMF